MSYLVSFRGCTLKLADKTEVLHAIDQATTPITIATVNPEFIEHAQHDAAFRAALEAADFCTVEGTGFAIGLWFARLFNASLPHVARYPGATMVTDLFERYSDGSKAFGLIGGAPGVAATFAEAQRTHHPRANILFAEDGGAVDATNPAVTPEQRTLIEQHRPDILLVGFGAPKQERWIQAAADLNIPVMIGVGGTFNFGTTKKRAPQWLRAFGLEWLYRGVTEPGHWKRVWRAVPVFATKTAWWAISTKGGRAGRRS